MEVFAQSDGFAKICAFKCVADFPKENQVYKNAKTLGLDKKQALIMTCCCVVFSFFQYPFSKIDHIKDNSIPLKFAVI